ncbi:MAG: cyclase family protein [Thermoplasmata archaeon]
MNIAVIDISLPLSGTTPCYPGDTPFARHEQKNLEKGDPVTLSELTLSAHAGTHVDVPSHVLPNAPSLDEVDVLAFSGPAQVLDLRGVSRVVGKHNLRPHSFHPGEIVLLKTRNSKRWQRNRFHEDYVYLSEEGADFLANREAKAVGIDALSIEGFHVEGLPAHRALLGQGVGIIEGLNLSLAKPGRYWLDCLPLRVVGGDGAPARAVLWEEAPPKAV